MNAALNRHVAAHGVFYAPDPSSDAACTIGGNVAENAGGPHCLKYGVTLNHVLAATVVLPDGEIIELGDADGACAGSTCSARSSDPKGASASRST